MSETFLMTPKILSGKDAFDTFAKDIVDFGKKALIVTGHHIVKDGTSERLQKNLSEYGIESIVYDGITGEPTVEMIQRGTLIYKEKGCDFLIGIGGGSPLDAMKAIAAMAVNEGEISDYMGKIIEGKLPPMIAIPTTAGTGSEVTQFTIITDTEKNIKMLLKGQALMPQLAVIDPELSVSSPKNVTAATGLDALTHSIEAYTSKKAQPLSDIMAISAVSRIFKYLPKAYMDGKDMEAREQMALAALEAGVAFNNSSVTLVHGMSRPIGALFHVPHGISNAMLLSVCLEYALPGAVDRFAMLGRAIGVADATMEDDMAAKAFLKAVNELCEVCEIPTLGEYGIDIEAFQSQIGKMAFDAMASGSPSNTRRALDQQVIEGLYMKLWYA